MQEASTNAKFRIYLDVIGFLLWNMRKINCLLLNLGKEMP